MRRTNPGGRDSVVPSAGDNSHADLANAIISSVCLASQGAVYDGMKKFKIFRESEMIKGMMRF
ncbi:MAG: hypothetical protein MUO31_09430 [Thermodesulfovibrionales bacterium]|nr:hypothetical protein [Thermodesulfovibrionales bacterium]